MLDELCLRSFEQRVGPLQALFLCVQMGDMQPECLSHLFETLRQEANFTACRQCHRMVVIALSDFGDAGDELLNRFGEPSRQKDRSPCTQQQGYEAKEEESLGGGLLFTLGTGKRKAQAHGTPLASASWDEDGDSHIVPSSANFHCRNFLDEGLSCPQSLLTHWIIEGLALPFGMAAIGCDLPIVQVDNSVRHILIFRSLLGHLLEFAKVIAQQVALAERRKVGGQGEGTLLRFMSDHLALSLFNNERHQTHDRDLDHDDHRNKFCPQTRRHQGGQAQEPLPADTSHGTSSLLTGLTTSLSRSSSGLSASLTRPFSWGCSA